MRRKVVAVWVSLLIMVSSIVILVEIAETVEAPPIPHDPIRINNNAEFASMAGSEGWSGDGSFGNPYIIEGYDINGSGFKTCIYIGNTTVHFELKDSYLHEASGDSGGSLFFSNSGIILFNVQNGTISNNTASLNNSTGISISSSNSNILTHNNASNNLLGIEIYASGSNIITNNTVSSNNYGGINILSSNNNILTNNTVYSSYEDGIALYQSARNTFIDNKLWGKGIFIWSHEIEDWNSHIINTTNTLNGKPIHYWKNQIGGSIPLDAGQVILANSTNVFVKNQNVSNTHAGILLGFSNNNTIINNTSSNNGAGIYLSYSNNNTIANNTAANNSVGIYIYFSHRNTIVNNNASINKNGITVYFSNSNTIVMNNVSSIIDYSINLRYSLYNIITDNLASNSYIGINVRDSLDNNIYHNIIINNTIQAYDNRMDNNWNNSYPIGGNYWSDYSGVDNLKGPYQDIPGSDGIGDTPYIIDTDSQDNYPLMTPFTNRTFENYTILKQGWNLISIPLIQEIQDLSTVLQMIEGYYDAVQWYDHLDSNDPWKHNKISKPFGNDLFQLNETMSFWIHITNPGDTIFLYNGTQPTSNQTIQLHPGWNMVGYPSLTNHNRTTGLNNLTFDTHVDAIQWYDAGTKTWHFMDQDDLLHKLTSQPP